ncbi:MAG: hypothetical protein ACRC0G_07790 [Fusobacteriaceae bacterium]
MAGYEKKDLNVNTRGIALYNSEESTIAKSTLRASFWNDKVVLDIHPALENMTEHKKFDYDTKVSAILSNVDLVSLESAISDVIMGDYSALAVPTSRGMIEFGKGNEELGIEGYYLNICETDENNVVTNSLIYLFKSSVIIKGYSYADATYDVMDNDSEVDLFEDFISNAIHGSSMAYAHFNLERTKYSDEKMKNSLTKLMEASGISTEYAGDKKTSSTGSKNSWSSSRKNEAKEIPTSKGDINTEDYM